MFTLGRRPSPGTTDPFSLSLFFVFFIFHFFFKIQSKLVNKITKISKSIFIFKYLLYQSFDLFIYFFVFSQNYRFFFLISFLSRILVIHFPLYIYIYIYFFFFLVLSFFLYHLSFFYNSYH